MQNIIKLDRWEICLGNLSYHDNPVQKYNESLVLASLIYLVVEIRYRSTADIILTLEVDESICTLLA